MRVQSSRVPINLLAAGLLLLAGATCLAGAHTWDYSEAFSTADGTVWFFELREPGGAAGENGVGGMLVTSTTSSASICILSEAPGCGLTGSTANKRILFGNAGYAELAALQGAPPADQIILTTPFFNVAGDNLKYNPAVPYDSWVFGAVPTNGTDSMNRTGAPVAPNTPTNFLGASGSINASSLPPSVVPDGTGTGNAMRVRKLDSTGATLRLNFDVNTCALNSNHQIIYGERSDLPTSPGGTYLPSGGVCGIGGASPYQWNTVPDATDGSGLIWFLVLVNNDSNKEGSWSTRDGVNERQGPGPNGSSGQCLVTDKSLTNSCGS